MLELIAIVLAKSILSFLALSAFVYFFIGFLGCVFLMRSANDLSPEFIHQLQTHPTFILHYALYFPFDFFRRLYRSMNK